MIKTDFSTYREQTQEIGTTRETRGAIVIAEGLPGARINEVVYFEDEKVGQIINLHKDHVEILLFSKLAPRVGTKITRSENTLTVPVSDTMLGKTVNPLGDYPNRKKEKTAVNTPIFQKATGISTRTKITRSLFTGISFVDLLLPLGMGQRQLVIGDRKTGKTNFLLQTISYQAKNAKTICIYAAIGKKKIDIKQIQERLSKFSNTIIVQSAVDDPAGIIFLTPYTAMSIAEYFRDKGGNVLLILDDLTTHAKFYREIALLGRRFPGRNSYPGDMFYTHARLLERAGNFNVNGKEAAITCLPVSETTQGDLSGYIQTNIMSMTDGHIFFDTNLFTKGDRPAINAFLSVTRVGHQTQSPLLRDANRELISFLTLSEKLQNYAHFGQETSQSTRNTLERGKKVRLLLEQGLDEEISPQATLYVFTKIWTGVWDLKKPEEVRAEKKNTAKRFDSDKVFQLKLNDIVDKSENLNDFIAKLAKTNL